jgi:hypothetical protein
VSVCPVFSKTLSSSWTQAHELADQNFVSVLWQQPFRFVTPPSSVAGTNISYAKQYKETKPKNLS